MCAAPLEGVKVAWPGSTQAAPTPFPPCRFSPETAVMIAAINGNILGLEEHLKFKLWYMELKVVNTITYPDIDVGLERALLVPLYDYITLRHSHSVAGASTIQSVFRQSLWLLTCHCSPQTRKEILSWMQEYLTSHTPQI